jgi:hypothetical protein
VEEKDGIWRMAGGVVPGRNRSKSATIPSSSLHSCEHPTDPLSSSQWMERQVMEWAEMSSEWALIPL